MRGYLSEGQAVYAAQCVFNDKHIILRLLGFDPTSGAVRLAIDENHDEVPGYRITATFGSGHSAHLDYNGEDPSRNNRPMLQTPRRNDTLTRIAAGPIPPPPVPTFNPDKACDQFKELERSLESAQREWMYFISPSTKDIRGTSANKSKQLARVAQEQMREIRQKIDWHRRGCGECQAAFE
jgi:hypothetical protein